MGSERFFWVSCHSQVNRSGNRPPPGHPMRGERLRQTMARPRRAPGEDLDRPADLTRHLILHRRNDQRALHTHCSQIRGNFAKAESGEGKTRACERKYGFDQ
jgi:hypothetical protein